MLHNGALRITKNERICDTADAAEHRDRMTPNWTPKTTFIGTVAATRPIGRPRTRWEEDTCKYLKALGGWRQPVEGRRGK